MTHYFLVDKESQLSVEIGQFLKRNNNFNKQLVIVFMDYYQGQDKLTCSWCTQRYLQHHDSVSEINSKEKKKYNVHVYGNKVTYQPQQYIFYVYNKRKEAVSSFGFRWFGSFREISDYNKYRTLANTEVFFEIYLGVVKPVILSNFLKFISM